MAAEKPSVFIGSSSEGKAIAGEIETQIKSMASVKIWDEGIFKLGESALESLVRSLHLFDFAVLVVSPDDRLQSRGKAYAVARDNVLFELGLFMGNLGPQRSFYICSRQTGKSLKLPSDLSGINTLYFDWNGKLSSLRPSLKPACDKLKNALKERYQASGFTLLPSTSLAIGYFQNFLCQVCSFLVDEASLEIDGNKVDLSKGSFEFNIVLPDNLSPGIPHEVLDKLKKDHHLTNVKIVRKSREFPFFVKMVYENNHFAFYDFPTTLMASRQAIAYVLRKRDIEISEDQKIMERKEISNFERTLRLLLQEPEAAAFKDRVNIVHLADLH